jgi:hypothetical protein
MGLYRQMKELNYRFSFLEEGMSLSDLYSLEPGQKILISSIVGVRLVSYPCLFEDVDNLFLKTYYYFPPLDLEYFSEDTKVGSYYIPDYNNCWSVKYPTRKVRNFND